MFKTDWTELLEIAIRGSIMYLSIFGLFRVLRRGAGGLNTPDLLVVVLVADAAQNALGGSYRSVPAGAVLVFVIMGWSVLIDVFVYRFPRLGRLFEPGPTVLVKEGLVLHRNLRRNLITRDELMDALRAQGLEQLSDVRSAYLEGDGSINVIPITSQ